MSEVPSSGMDRLPGQLLQPRTIGGIGDRQGAWMRAESARRSQVEKSREHVIVRMVIGQERFQLEMGTGEGEE